MEQGSRGVWKKLAQTHAEKLAAKAARLVWLAYWKKYDGRRRQEKKPKR